MKSVMWELIPLSPFQPTYYPSRLNGQFTLTAKTSDFS